jgi:hypothetical protein
MLREVGAADRVKFGCAVTVRLTVVLAVNVPEVPVMVTVVGPPTVAVGLAVSVKTLDVVVLVGLNDAVTPAGRVEVTAKFTVPVNPLSGFTVIVLVPLLPWATLNVLGAAESVKLDGGVIVRLTVVVCVSVPEVPVMVMVNGPPLVAEGLTVNVKTLVVVVLVGLKDAVTPLGKPEVTAKLTVPVKPFSGFTVIVLVPLPPLGTLRLLGAADRVKLPAPVTVRLIVVVWVSVPDVPVIVTVVGPPTVAVALAVNVNTLVLLVLVGLKDAVTPEGRVEVTARLTLPVKPFSGLIVIVLVPLLP